jgi:hypothetical protein
MSVNRYANWFGRALWLGILVNLSFAIPALFFPSVFTTQMGLGGLTADAGIWLRDAGMLLVLLCGFYALVASDPLAVLAFARWSVAARFVAAGFWLWLILGVGLPSVLWWCFATDFSIGVVLLLLLWRAQVVSPPPVRQPWRPTFFERVSASLFAWLELRVGMKWYHFKPAILGSLAGGGLRRALRARNLYASPNDVPDSAANRVAPDPTTDPHPLGPWNPDYRTNRSPDGSYNDLSQPSMGMNAMQFGRNFPPAETEPKVPPEGDLARNIPNPRDISIHLLARPTGADGNPVINKATSLNLLAAAWIQFQNHGWFNHRIPQLVPDANGQMVPANPITGQPIPFDENRDFIHIPFTDPNHMDNQEWTRLTGQKSMRIHRTIPDPTRRPDASYPPTYRTTEVHWWSASQIYGHLLEVQKRLRTHCDGKMKTVEIDLFGQREVLLPLDDQVSGLTAMMTPANQARKELGVDLTGFNDNYWVGTSLLHTLFVREHNYLCDELQKKYAGNLAGMCPVERDKWLFGKARLIVAAMMAKIHTVEWTPGILDNPILHIDMPANWWGLLGRWFKMHFGRVSTDEVWSGIIGSQAEQHAAPYSLTEDFVAVYRLHPLIPDMVEIHERIPTGKNITSVEFMDIQGLATRQAVLDFGVTNWLYSFGKQSPGAITLRNYPKALRQLERVTGEFLDLATRDIVRDRERGIPLYNQFRRLVRMRPIRSYKELVGHRPDAEDLIATLRRLYGQTPEGGDNVEQIDLLVGLLGEKCPPGFGFSDTAFRIFILMASRRLKSDRYFTDDFRPEVYTEFGIDYVNKQTMTDMLERHYPLLRNYIPRGKNPFAPWGNN